MQNYGWVQPMTTWSSATTAVIYPTQIVSPASSSDWERAAVKAEPDDEFTWLRKRVREMEELAFA